MKEKMTIGGGEQYFQTSLPLGCWKPACCKKQNVWGRLLKKYQLQIDNAVAGTAIALMAVTGIWMFLVQLAEYGG